MKGLKIGTNLGVCEEFDVHFQSANDLDVRMVTVAQQCFSKSMNGGVLVYNLVWKS